MWDEVGQFCCNKCKHGLLQLHMRRLLTKLDFAEAKFSLYYLGYEPEQDVPEDKADRVCTCWRCACCICMQLPTSICLQIEWMFNRRGTVELTHNW